MHWHYIHSLVGTTPVTKSDLKPATSDIIAYIPKAFTESFYEIYTLSNPFTLFWEKYVKKQQNWDQLKVTLCLTYFELIDMLHENTVKITS